MTTHRHVLTRWLLTGLTAGLLAACGQDAGKSPGNHEHHAGHGTSGASAGADEHAAMAGDDTLYLAPRQQALADLRTVIVRDTTLSGETALLGTVVPDESRQVQVSARVRGRIEQLFVAEPGQAVRRGQPLYRLYSDELLSAASEYVRLHAGSGAHESQLAAGARQRLHQWGVTETQLRQLEQRGQVPAALTFASPATGYVAELLVREGAYVEDGTPLLRLTDPTAVWVEAQVYPAEVNVLRQAKQLTTTTDALPGRVFPARLVYDNPGLEADRRLLLARLRVANPNQQLRPGMMAAVHLGNRTSAGLAVPRGAINFGPVPTLWVQTSPTTFERRMVTVGTASGDQVIIGAGVQAGDRVVAAGAYLLESERSVRRGNNSMAGHKM